MDQAKVYAEYTTGCFCKKRDLSQFAVYTPYEPRFHFQKAAKTLARQIGCDNVLPGRNGNKVALARLLEPCAHHEEQWVRISWTTIY